MSVSSPAHSGGAGWNRRCAGAGGLAAALGGACLFVMQRLPATRHLNPMTEPLSKYALTSAGWLFDTASVVMALGVAGVVAALALERLVAVVSLASVALALSGLGLVALVVFPDYTTDAGRLTPIGWVHWISSLAAFGGAPVAALSLAGRHPRGAGCSRLLAIARWLALAAGAGLGVFVAGTVLEWTTHVPVWRIGGALERCLAGVEILIALVLAGWAWRGCECRRASIID